MEAKTEDEEKMKTERKKNTIKYRESGVRRPQRPQKQKRENL